MQRVVLTVCLVFSALAAVAAPAPATGGGTAPASGDAPPSWNNFLGLGKFLLMFARESATQSYDQQDFGRAANFFELLHRIDPSDREITKRLGFALKESGRYEEAHDLLFQCTVEDPNDFQAWWWLSDTQRLLGDYKKARESMATARDAAPENERAGLQTYVDYTEALGVVAPDWGNFEKHREFAKRHERMRRARRTIAEYMTALDTLPPAGPEATDAPLRRAWVLNQIGLQYNQLKQPDYALDYFQRAARSYAEANSNADVMLAQQNLAVTYRVLASVYPARRTEFLELGATHWAETLRIAREQGDVPYIRYSQAGQLLCLVEARGVADPAVQAARAANLPELPWKGPINDYTTAAVAMAELACRALEGDMAGMRVVAEMALPFYTGSTFLLDLEEAVNVYLQLARAFTLQGHHDEALKQADLAETRMRELRAYMDADAFSRSVNTQALRAIAVARIRAQILKGDFDAARRAADAYHIEARADLLGNKIEEDLSRNDFTTELELLTRGLAMLDKDVETATSAGDAAEAARLAERIAQDKQRKAWLEKGVRFNAAEAVSYREIPVLGPLELGPRWPINTQMLSILTDSFGAVAVLFDGKTAWACELPGASEDVLSSLATEPGLEAVSSLLIAPLADRLTAATLYVATSGPLAAVPFELLRIGGEPLLAKRDIAYAPSASHLIQLQTRPRAKGTAVRIAGEAGAAIATALPSAVACATELCATQPVDAAPAMLVRGALDLSAPDPTLCAISLGPEGLYDGTLYAAELLGARVNTNAVWLAPQGMAASSRLDAWAALEEGFMQAGARAVVIPVAPLNDDDLAGMLKPTLGADGLTLASLSAAKRAALAADPENVAAAALRFVGVD